MSSEETPTTNNNNITEAETVNNAQPVVKSDNSENSNNDNLPNLPSVSNEIWPQSDETAQLNQIAPSEDKPAVGSDEWHRQRRENHKQVERKRRELISESINELERIVPGCEKNKSSILQRTAVYIRQLKDAEAATIEKWTLEKLLTEQAITELNRQIEVLKSELDHAHIENDYMKRELEQRTQSQAKKIKLDIED